jgi:phage major head subunit gpT-like protein
MIKITLKGLNGVFSHELSRAPLGYVRSLAAMFSSNQSKEEYVGVGQAPSLELFKGEHHYSELGEDSFEVANKKWTTGISIPKETFLDDKTGDLRKRMADLAAQVQDHRDAQLFDVLVNGATTKYKCYDGKKLFATDHKTRDSGVQSNDLSFTGATTGNDPTPIEIGDAILFTIRQILGIKDDRGRKMNRSARNFQVIVPMNMMEAAMAAINSDVLQGTSGTLDNVMKKQKRFSISIEPEPEWEDDDTIVVARTDGPKPLLLQEKRGIETHMHGPGTEIWDTKKALRYGVEVNFGVAPYFWQGIARTTLS